MWVIPLLRMTWFIRLLRTPYRHTVCRRRGRPTAAAAVPSTAQDGGMTGLLPTCHIGRYSYGADTVHTVPASKAAPPADTYENHALRAAAACCISWQVPRLNDPAIVGLPHATTPPPPCRIPAHAHTRARCPYHTFYRHALHISLPPAATPPPTSRTAGPAT